MENKHVFPAIKIALISMLLVRAFMLTAQHTIIGTTDINAFIKNVPGLPSTTPEAARRAYGANPLQSDHVSMDNFYKPFEEKVGSRIKDYQDFAKQRMQQGNATEAAYRQQTEAMVNSNPIIANMGGYEKVSQMSEAEARAAALKATAQHTADPFAANGVQSAGMTALYQKIISDPAYAKKFEKMSEAEKEAELRKYMANDKPVAMTPDQMKARETQMATQNRQVELIRNAQEIQLKLSDFMQKVSEVSTSFGQKLQEIEQQGRTHEAISAEVQKRYEAIPFVELGEYGRDHDPELVGPLRIEEAKLQRERAQQELKLNAVALADVAGRYQILVSEYLDYVKNNGDKIYGGTSAKDMMEGTNTEQPLVSFEAGLIGIALELSKYSRDLTANAAQWEANYLQTMQTYGAGK